MGRTSDAREKLIESAVELIHSRSYSEVGVNELCQHAGVKKGSFYHFFPSKQDLTLAALDRFTDMFRREFSGPAFAGDLPASERIQQVFEVMYNHQRTTFDATGHVWGCPVGNLALELSTQDEPIRQKVQQVFEMMMEMVEHCSGRPSATVTCRNWISPSPPKRFWLISKACCSSPRPGTTQRSSGNWRPRYPSY